MAESTSAMWSKDTVAVVSGSNKGIGYELVRQLAKQGLTTVLTARDQARGQAALEALKAEGLQSVHFHRLDVTDTKSVTTLVAWLQEAFGAIDILVHNAGIQKFSQAYADAVETLETNYYGVKRVTKEFLPLCRESPAGARIVIITSRLGLLQRFENKHVKDQLSDVEHLTESMIDAVAAKYLSDVKEGRWKEEGWAPNCEQYSESKLLVTAYARFLARSLASADPPVSVNAICPGGMDTDMVTPFLKILGKHGPRQI